MLIAPARHLALCGHNARWARPLLAFIHESTPTLNGDNMFAQHPSITLPALVARVTALLPPLALFVVLTAAMMAPRVALAFGNGCGGGV